MAFLLHLPNYFHRKVVIATRHMISSLHEQILQRGSQKYRIFYAMTPIYLVGNQNCGPMKQIGSKKEIDGKLPYSIP